ncbi:DUF6602 domain-containing protein [Flavobacterium sp.]|uniref:DUF6602 domain-containing protein n=1 Tax=Flavobacterium sp. TaxID=239 RepID=UPI002ED86692
MIQNIAEFLEELKKNGIEIIKASEYVKHPGLIGEMYEGLTTELLNKSIFKGFDLRVCSGKVKNNTGGISAQIDCMLVVGEGEDIPFTDKKVYHYSKVIAVFEVKKTLNKTEIIDSFAKMRTITEVSSNPDFDGEKSTMQMLRTAWQILTNTELPARNVVDALPEHLQYIYHVLFMEAFLPLRISIGYYGYKTEYALRNAFWKLLEEKTNLGERKGLGIGSFPSMIICGNNSLIKGNGMPNAIPFHDSHCYWSIYISSDKNPLLNLLDLIWTRLSFKFGISSTSIFDDGLTYEMFHRFIDCRFDKTENMMGWSYNYIEMSDSDLNLEAHEQKWVPVELDKFEFILINTLIKKEKIDRTEWDFNEFVKEKGVELDKILERLHKERLIFYNDTEIKLSTQQCHVTRMKGKFYAGEDGNGLMSKWIEQVRGS